MVPISPQPAPAGRGQHNGVAYVSGQLPRIDGRITCLGRLGESVSLEQGVEAAGVCALNALSVLEAALGNLDRIEQFLKVTGFVASSPTSRSSRR